MSLAVHTLLIGLAVVATAPRVLQRLEIPEVFARFLAPQERMGGQEAQHEQLKFVALGEAAAPVRGARLVPLDQVSPIPDRQISGLDMATMQAAPAAASQDSVFTLIEVDSAATRYSWSAAPAYPAAMLAAKREGFVRAQWVVDEAGYADTTTLTLIGWTSEEFAKSVRDALPFMRFSPAKVGSKAVKQLVEQEFTFRITSVLPGAAADKKP